MVQKYFFLNVLMHPFLEYDEKREKKVLEQQKNNKQFSSHCGLA